MQYVIWTFAMYIKEVEQLYKQVLFFSQKEINNLTQPHLTQPNDRNDWNEQNRKMVESPSISGRRQPSLLFSPCSG
jgi:hypothetical protein